MILVVVVGREALAFWMQDNERNPSVTPEQLELLCGLENLSMDSLRALVAEIESIMALNLSKQSPAFVGSRTDYT